MFDNELQKAAARYATAKAVEVYVWLAVAVFVVSWVIVVGYGVVQTVMSTFGL